MPPECKHLNQIRITEPSEHACPECVAQGDSWVHLRMCLTCGHIGCCDSSKNKHATRHFQQSQHPLMRSIEDAENWIWCYVDNLSPGEVDEAA